MSAEEQQQEQQQQPVVAVPETESAPKASGTKLYVGNIEYRTTREEIEELFKDYNVTKIDVPTNRIPKKGAPGFIYRTKGYVFVTFEGHDDELDDIIAKFTDTEFKDRKIYLRYLDTNKENKTKEKNEAAAGSNGESSGETGAKAESKTKQTAKKSVRESKKKIPFDQGEKSTDTLYLKNLDFSVKAEDIKTFFEAEGETALWVSVPLLKLPGFVLKKLQAQNKSLDRRNKGYAFVKLELKDGETIEDKVAKFNGKVLNDRELLTSVAVDVRKAKTDAETEAEPVVATTEAETEAETGTEAETEAETGTEAEVKVEAESSPVKIEDPSA
jgi:RNA recognition motif-containing protein